MDYKKLYWKMIAHYKKTRTVPESKLAKHLIVYNTIHHAWPRCIRPDLINDMDNLVALTYREHVVIHLIFGKAYGEEYPQVMQSSAYILLLYGKHFYLSPVSTRMAEEQRRESSRTLLVEDEHRMDMLMLGGQIYRELNPMSEEERKRRADKAWETRVERYGPTGMKEPKEKKPPQYAKGKHPRPPKFSQDQIDKLKELLSKGVGTLKNRHAFDSKELKIVKEELGLSDKLSVRRNLRKLVLEIEANEK